MKKVFLLLIASLLIGASVNAQKLSLSERKAIVKELVNPLSKGKISFERSGAYLQDSTKLYDIDEVGDSTAWLIFRSKFNANGTIKEVLIDTYFLPFFESHSRYENFYTPNKPFLFYYQKYYTSKDKGLTYQLESIDTAFYDNKDRIVRFNSGGDTDVYIYNTNFNQEDTLRGFNGSGKITYEYDYTLNTKGIVVEQIYKVLNLNGDLELRNKDIYKYNAQDQITENISDSWNVTDSKWVPNTKVLNYYNTNQTNKYDISYEDYDETTKDWLIKDSTFYSYNAKGQNFKKTTFTYDFDNNKYIKIEEISDQFDVNGNKVRSATNRIDENDPTKFTFVELEKNWYSFFKDAIAAKDIYSKDYQLVVRNPVLDNTSVNIATDIEGVYNFMVFSVQGRMIRSESVQNNQSVSLNLPAAGQYILVLTDKNNKPLTMKKVIKL
jgi:hypothetical protein